MKKPNVKLTKKQIVLLVITVACLLLLLITTLISKMFVGKVPTQASASVWDEDNRSEMISMFVNSNHKLDKDSIRILGYQLDALLVEESISASSETARLYVTAYGTKGETYVSSDRAGSVKCNAYYVGGDFFRFHPYELVSGCYIKEDDALKQGVVLDEDAAWKLFGAINVDGMSVTINSRDYTVIGIVKADKSYKAVEGGAKENIVYIPFDTVDMEADFYEIIFPNPVTDFALKNIKSALEGAGYNEENSILVDNTNRYKLLPSLKRVGKWMNKGMSFREITYPYWENQAIAIENIVDLLTVFKIIFVIPPVIIIIVSIICFHPIHRFKLLILKIVDKIRK